MQGTCVEEGAEDKVQGVKRKFEARIGVMPSGKVVKKRPIKKLWIDGKVSEHRKEWMREVQAHCEMRREDMRETSRVPEASIQERRE